MAVANAVPASLATKSTKTLFVTIFALIAVIGFFPVACLLGKKATFGAAFGLSINTSAFCPCVVLSKKHFGRFKSKEARPQFLNLMPKSSEIPVTPLGSACYSWHFCWHSAGIPWNYGSEACLIIRSHVNSTATITCLKLPAIRNRLDWSPDPILPAELFPNLRFRSLSLLRPAPLRCFLWRASA